MSPHITPTPRDQRVIMLSAMSRQVLGDRARALGWLPDTVARYHTTRDELIAMILDEEQSRGLVAR